MMPCRDDRMRMQVTGRRLVMEMLGVAGQVQAAASGALPWEPLVT